MKVITKEQIAIIQAANESVKGTNNYHKYYMACEFKSSKGKWVYSCYGVPTTAADYKVKSYGDRLYIMTRDDERYAITEEVLSIIQ